MKNLKLLILILLMSASCNAPFDSEVLKIEIISGLQSCEEQNLHFQVKEVFTDTDRLKKNQIVLPVFSISLNDSINNNLFFPVDGKAGIAAIVSGRISKYGHQNYSDGCTGSMKFLIEEIVDVLPQ